ncbi:hypothetical protein CFN79_18825 [Chromobacterium vaccinii]|uniref:hypothetical protein n=1 Tax=Chromobacterium vaccinii TaxID=1108595 RepID=UPI000CE95B01|nr:hypothetical protein [Chromobacterium vaccinii]AVG17752.1 hypothetical protein CFN79_18825 [Chromobacterium vaccinii]
MAYVPDAKPANWVTLTREGSFSNPRYGRFEISRDMLLAMARNFEAGMAGTGIFLNVNHQPGGAAAAKVCKLAVEGGRLRALVEWTDFGREAVPLFLRRILKKLAGTLGSKSRCATAKSKTAQPGCAVYP